jgi:CRISPR-associated protein Csm4
MHLFKLKLHPGSQFHLGNNTPFLGSVLHETATHIHSDTLFSALINIAKKLGRDGELVDYFRNGDLKISSCFYLLESPSTTIYFLPKPLCPITDETNYKKLKKIQYVSTGVFQSGIGINNWLSEKNKGILFNEKNWIATKEELQALLGGKNENLFKNISFFDKQNIPQVRVHTNETQNNFYQNTNLQIADLRELHPELRVHFYCLASGINELFKQTLALLEDEGIGGQRSTGCGNIEKVEWMAMPEIFNFKGDTYNCSLSLTAPAKEDLPYLENSFYQTLFRGGRRIRENHRLKQIVMLKEGCITDFQLSGKIKDISPNNHEKYLRYGKAFNLPIPQNILT